MRAVVLVLLLAASQAGCSLLSAWSFKPSDLSGVAKHRTALVLYPRDTGEEANPKLKKAIAEDNALWSRIKERCESHSFKINSAGSILFAALGQAAFNAWADAKQRRIQDIVDSAQKSYSLTTAIPPDLLSNTRCALLVRYQEPEDKSLELELGAVVLLQFQSADVPSASEPTSVFSVQPIYVYLTNAVAVTKDDPKPTASVSTAVAIKALAQQGSRLNRLLPVGEAATTVADVVIGQTNGRCADKDDPCKRSDLVPFPMRRGTLSVTVAITEQGVTGFNDKAALAELAAIKEAVGPAIGEAIKGD